MSTNPTTLAIALFMLISRFIPRIPRPTYSRPALYCVAGQVGTSRFSIGLDSSRNDYRVTDWSPESLFWGELFPKV
jgi:hypothetical protein